MSITKKFIEEYFPLGNSEEKLIRKINKNSLEYEKNFKLMEQSSDKKYRDIEKQLNIKDIKLRKQLRIHITVSQSEMKEFAKRARLISRGLEEKALARA